jgi:hypothetical protein
MPMAMPERSGQAELANLAAAIERAAADLALAEEPARFVAALESAAPEPGPPSPPESARD